ncbi:hypothetical protein [Flammeovirga aprica]|uniref:Uncharacterized protein n=1 Tax=Flammeovirga aprica JL-4 TaxID=694437 RepID=A0A7X9S1D4_9BACT|nr:hypothetical protein [Flammeovirga aprica]NME72559.1 hypothetical protein [Flammeovirga aprica JL-4]
MKRRKRANRMMNFQTNRISVLTIVVLLIGILLYLTNTIQNKKVVSSYCGDFGFGGKSLTLLNDGSFRFWYSGCSQNIGAVKGEWKKEGDTFVFHPYQENEILHKQYHEVENRLIAIDGDTLVLCDDYIPGYFFYDE